MGTHHFSNTGTGSGQPKGRLGCDRGTWFTRGRPQAHAQAADKNVLARGDPSMGEKFFQFQGNLQSRSWNGGDPATDPLRFASNKKPGGGHNRKSSGKRLGAGMGGGDCGVKKQPAHQGKFGAFDLWGDRAAGTAGGAGGNSPFSWAPRDPPGARRRLYWYRQPLHGPGHLLFRAFSELKGVQGSTPAWNRRN